MELETEYGRRCRKHEILERTRVTGSLDRPWEGKTFVRLLRCGGRLWVCVDAFR